MSNYTPPTDNNDTVPRSPSSNEGVTRAGAPFDYSRSATPAGNHWYGLPGQPNPLAQPSATQPKPPYPPPQPAPFAPTEYNSRTRNRVEGRRRRQSSGLPENWVMVIIAIAMLGLTITTSIILIFVLSANRNNDPQVSASAPQIEPTSAIYANVSDATNSDSTPVAGALEGNSLQIKPWNGSERFTILVMGLDNRPGEGSEACRTDTMMIISIDPNLKRIGILSIPRDTYVEIPYHGLNRINAACTIGNLYQTGNGPKLAMQTVQYNFGIRINDYIMVDFETFISLIDRIGGVDVTVRNEIVDDYYPDMNYGYDPFYLAAGEQHLDGATALKYARSRHSSDDIDRAQRQQDIVYAVRGKILSVNMVDDLLIQAPAIWSDLEGGIETGLSLEQIVQLALYAKDIPAENIVSGVVSWEYLMGHKTEGGASVLVPRREALIPLMLQVFGEGYNR